MRLFGGEERNFSVTLPGDLHCSDSSGMRIDASEMPQCRSAFDSIATAGTSSCAGFGTEKVGHTGPPKGIENNSRNRQSMREKLCPQSAKWINFQWYFYQTNGCNFICQQCMSWRWPSILKKSWPEFSSAVPLSRLSPAGLMPLHEAVLNRLQYKCRSGDQIVSSPSELRKASVVKLQYRRSASQAKFQVRELLSSVHRKSGMHGNPVISYGLTYLYHRSDVCAVHGYRGGVTIEMCS